MSELALMPDLNVPMSMSNLLKLTKTLYWTWSQLKIFNFG